MKIKFLKDCEAPQMRSRYCCEHCGYVPGEFRLRWFYQDEELDPDIELAKIHLSELTYRVDYDIVEYP